MKRYCVPNGGHGRNSIRKAIEFCLRECEAIRSCELTIITRFKDGSFEDNTIGEFFGDALAAKLTKGKAFPVELHDVVLKHESVATVQEGRAPQVALALYLSAAGIQTLDEVNFDCLVFLPWLADEGRDWAAKWSAEGIGDTTQGGEIDLPHQA